MRIACLSFILLAAALPGVSLAGEKKSLASGADRGTLEDRIEKVRGDSGKWRDQAGLQVLPSLTQKPEKTSLDSWADVLAEKRVQLNSASETWLIHRTEQLDDNDRVWVESIERDGKEITIVFARATWQGDYSKNFTWYQVTAVNLGKLAAGDYRVTWTEKPLVFRQFEDPANRRASWPKDEREPENGAKIVPSIVRFSVSE